MNLATHFRFSGYVPRLPERFDEPRLLSIKIEPAPAPIPPSTLYDVLLEDRGTLYVLPFIERRNGRVLIPSAEPAFANTVAAVEPQLLAMEQAFLETHQASLELFSSNAEIVHLATAQNAGLVIPGLSAYGPLFDFIDRYRYATQFTYGRAILDIHPGCGYGAVVLGKRIARYAALTEDEESARVLARFDFATAEPMEAAQAVVALGVPPADVAATLARARQTGAARIMISSPGEAGEAALRAAGLDPTPLLRPGLDALPHPDFVARTEPPRVFTSVATQTGANEERAARPLSILFVLRPSAPTKPGGDVVQVRETADALRARGHRVEISADEEPSVPDGIDIVHLSNLTCPDETLRQARAVGSFRGPIVMMPIFIDHADEATWGMQASFEAIRQAATGDELRVAQRGVAERTAVITRPDGLRLLPPPLRADLGPNYTQKQREILQFVDVLIGNAYSEIYCIHRHLSPRIPFAIAPSCCNPAVYHPDRAREFEEKYNLRDFILSTGRVEARKQQLTLMQVARRWPDRPLVLIGRNEDIGYGALMRICWAENVTLIGHMSENELAGAYAAARVVAMPSWDEVVSLTSVNAAACGASLVLTRNGFEHEYMRDDAFYCDPGDTESIASAIDDAWNSHEERRERRTALSERVRREYTWARSAEATENAYYRVLASNPRGRRRLER